MTEGPTDGKTDLVIDLNFVPAWARTPPAEAAVPGDSARPERRDDRDQRRSFDRAARGPGGGPPFRREDRRGPRTGASRDARAERRPAVGRPVVPWPPPVAVEFLPERRGLGPLAHRLVRSGRAYSLFEVASLFLSKPDYYVVRLTVVGDSQPQPMLYQCDACKAVFLDRGAASAHGFERHFERFCTKEEKVVDPPKGNFVCVARCGLSGTLLGPPNYHGFTDRVAELHRSRFGHMPFEAYRQRIENVHDAALIDQWKESMCRQTIYHFAGAGEPVTLTRFADAEAYFHKHCMKDLVREGSQFFLAGSVAQSLDDQALQRLIQETVQREVRFPLKLSITLRLAFRHLGLHTFRTGNGMTFLTAIAPSAIDPQQAVPVVREILEQIAAKPGCTYAELVGAMRPGMALDAPEAVEVARQLRWLVEKGHVIEFSDGRLAVPRGDALRIQHARPPERHRRKSPRKGDHKDPRPTPEGHDAKPG